MIYLDNAAAAPMTETAMNAYLAAAKEAGNPSAAHAQGRKLQEDIAAERAYFLSLFRPAAASLEKEEAFIFCSSLTEANNMMWRGLTLRPGDEIFFSPADHPSLTMVQDFYATSPLAAGGIKVRPLPLERGRLDEAMFFASLGPQTKLILLSSVNNTCGLINPVERWSWEIKRHAPQALIHLDHGQGFLKHPLQTHCFDSIAVPSIKIGGPGGIAGLWLRQKTIWHPWLYGGGHEYNLRASSLTYPLIKSFAAAVREQVPQVAARAKTAAHLKQVFQQTLRQEVEGIRFWVEEDDEGQENGQGLTAFSPYMTLAYFPKVSSDILMRYLEREDIMVAASSACSSHIAGYDPVLAALGLLESDHKKVLRFSWAATIPESDLAMAAHRVAYHYRSLAKFAGR